MEYSFDRVSELYDGTPEFENWEMFDSTGELEDEFNFTAFPSAVLEVLRKGLESVAVRLAATFGYRDENKLTNLIFFARHPERNGRKIQRDEPNSKRLGAEWLDIRNNLVRPILAGASSPGRRPTGILSGACAVVSGGCVRCGSCSACERRLRAASVPRLVPVPRELRFRAKKPIQLDAQALNAYQRLVREARADGIGAPYLKIHSGFRDYTKQANLWRGRLLNLFEKRGCDGAHLTCVARAIKRTTLALRSAPIPHAKNAWSDRFVRELKRAGCTVACAPRSLVRQLRKGTAPPGRSPHHTGRAVDIHVGGGISTAAGNVRFQRKQAAFRWLVCNAGRFGFSDSPEKTRILPRR